MEPSFLIDGKHAVTIDCAPTGYYGAAAGYVAALRRRRYPMPRSFSRVVLAAVAIVLLASPSTVFACPNCKYSPDGWGFCFYYQLAYVRPTKRPDTHGRRRCRIRQRLRLSRRDGQLHDRLAGHLELRFLALLSKLRADRSQESCLE